MIMKKKNKKRRHGGVKTSPKTTTISEYVRRKNEIQDYGKLVSLRPSVIMKSKKDYKRDWKLDDYVD